MILEPLYFSNALKRKKSFVYHKKVQDQKYDIFKVYQAFTVMQGPNFRKENQKKGKRIELVFSNFYKRLFVTQRLENRKDKKSNQYNLVLKKIEITSLSVKFPYLFNKMINTSDVMQSFISVNDDLHFAIKDGFD